MGRAIDRSGGKNKVDSVAAILIKRSFRLAVLPEGTRKKWAKLKPDSITLL
jgi:hypothetical protein